MFVVKSYYEFHKVRRFPVGAGNDVLKELGIARLNMIKILDCSGSFVKYDFLESLVKRLTVFPNGCLDFADILIDSNSCAGHHVNGSAIKCGEYAALVISVYRLDGAVIF